MATCLSWPTILWHLNLSDLFQYLKPHISSVPGGPSYWSAHPILEFLKESAPGPLLCSCSLSLWPWVCMSALWRWLPSLTPDLTSFCRSSMYTYMSTEYFIGNSHLFCVLPGVLIIYPKFAHSVFPISTMALSFILLSKPETQGSSFIDTFLVSQKPNLSLNPFDASCKMFPLCTSSHHYLSSRSQHHLWAQLKFQSPN